MEIIAIFLKRHAVVVSDNKVMLVYQAALARRGVPDRCAIPQLVSRHVGKHKWSLV